ncbi:unnamed protein product [Staurois parvus]|uniref:PH domain-containing protein n=1 Tax=Staurois parvus TaxID=386267 RepID=A0ABN9EN88_9NEOB|nr:unnamed protein product [Staurois parvus]
MGQMIHYSKVKFRFQHNQDISDCYLELFQSHLYFQSRGPTGLTYQGLVPLKELSVYKLERSKVPPKLEEEHAFRITGPLLNPLIVYCATPQELQKWLYHLEKQIQLNGGNLDLLPVTEVNNGNMWEKSELRRSVQNQPVLDWQGTQRESLGAITCISKVKLQTLPFQELNERMLVLYPSTLVILSEEGKNLCFKGELPLKAIRVIADEKEKRKSSFLLEGRYINTIRVICYNQQDYDEWIEHLKRAQQQNRDSSLSGSSSFCGSHSAHHEQVTASCRSSFTSDGRTKSWASSVKLPSSNHQSTNTIQGSEQQSYTILGEQTLQEDPLSPGYSQPVHCLVNPNWPSGQNGPSDLQRGGSIRESKGKRNLCVQIPSVMPQSYDLENTPFVHIPETPSEDILSPLYKEPYSYEKSKGHSSVTPQQLLSRMTSLTDSQKTLSPPDSQTLSMSPLYAEPYTPTGTSSNRLVDEILQNLTSNRNESHVSDLKINRSFHGISSPHLALHKKYSHPVTGSQKLVRPMVHRNSEPDTSIDSRLIPTKQTHTPFFKSISSVKEEIALSHHSKEVEDMFDLPSEKSETGQFGTRLCRVTKLSE